MFRPVCKVYKEREGETSRDHTNTAFDSLKYEMSE